MKGFSFIKRFLFLFLFGVGIVSLSCYSTFKDTSLDDSVSSSDSLQQDPPESLSSGTIGGYNFVKPFNLSGRTESFGAAGYIGSDGYLYTTGYQWGTTTWYKQTNAGTNIKDYEINRNYGIVLNSSGNVKIGAKNTSTTATWSNVTVGGSTTNGVAVAMGEYYQMVLNSSDVLYVAEDGATTMTDVVSSAATSSSRGGIVDFSMGNSYQFVLYGNGDLYRGLDGAVESGMTLVASNVKMFDYEGLSSYVYIYNSSNQIQVASVSSSSWTTLVTVANVVQIRGAYYSASLGSGWGYLTSDGTLKTYEGGYASTSLTRTVTGVDYFDNTSSSQWGYLKSGKMYFWNITSTNSNISSSSSPAVVSGTYASNNSFSIGSLSIPPEPPVYSIKNTPPAITRYAANSSSGTSVTVSDTATTLTSIAYGNHYRLSYASYSIPSDKRIKITITGTAETEEEEEFSKTWYDTSTSYAGDSTLTNYPKEAGTYTITSLLETSSGGTIDGSEANVLTYTITNTTAATVTQTTAQSTALGTYLTNNAVLLNSENVYSKIYDGVRSGIVGGTYSTVSANYNSSTTSTAASTQYTAMTHASLADKNWQVIITNSSTSTTALTSITTSGTYYVRFRLLGKSDTTNGIKNYDSSAWVTKSFTIAARSSSLTASNIGITESFTTAAGSPTAAVDFGKNYYVNINNTTYYTAGVAGTAAYSQAITISNSAGTVIRSFNYNDTSLNTAALAHTQMPKSPGTYTIKWVITAKDGHIYGTVSKTYTIAKEQVELTVTDAVSTDLSEYNILHEEDGTKTDLLPDMLEDLINGVVGGTYINMSTNLRTVTSGTYESYSSTYDYTQDANAFLVYITSGANDTYANRKTTLTEAGTYYAWVQYDPTRTGVTNTALKNYYTASSTTITSARVSFVIEPRVNTLTASNLAFSTGTGMTETSGLSTTATFGDVVYLNINSNKYVSTTDFVQNIKITHNTNSAYSYGYDYNVYTKGNVLGSLPKVQGTYTVSVKVFGKDGHYYGEVTQQLTITSNTPVITTTAAAAAELSAVQINNDKNLVDDFNSKIVAGISNGTFITVTRLAQINSAGNTLADQDYKTFLASAWTIYYTTGPTATSTKTTNIATAGTYYAWIQLESSNFTFGTMEDNYQDSNIASIEITIAPRTSSLNESNIGLTTTTDINQSGTVLSNVDFGSTYYININDTTYFNTGYSQTIVVTNKTTGKSHTAINYNSLDSLSGMWGGLPKEAGQYTITLTVTATDGHVYGVLTKDYVISQVAPVITVTADVEAYLGTTPLMNNINLIDNLKSKIITNRASENSYLGISNDLFTVGGTELAPTLNSYTIAQTAAVNWDIKFSSQTNSSVYLDQISADGYTDGFYYAYVTLVDIAGGNYTNSNTIRIGFYIAPKDGDGEIDFSQESVGISTVVTTTSTQDEYVLSTGTAGTEGYVPGSVLTVDFGAVYFINLSSRFFEDHTDYDFTTYITVIDANAAASDGAIVNRYDYSTAKNSTLFSFMPKNVGSYIIVCEIVDEDGHQWVYLENTYSIVSATVTVELTTTLSDDLSETQVFNDGTGALDLLPGLITIVQNGLIAGKYGEVDPGLRYVTEGNQFAPLALSSTLASNWEVYFTDNVLIYDRLTKLDSAGTYLVWVVLKDVNNYETTVAISIEFTIAPRSIVGIGGDDTETTEGFGLNSIGLSTSEELYETNAELISDTVNFGLEYYLNINSDLFDNTSDFIQTISISSASFGTKEYVYNDSINGKTFDKLSKFLPKATGDYTLSLTVTGTDGHKYGTISKTVTIAVVDTEFEVDEEAIKTKLESNKLADGNDLYEAIIADLSTLFSNKAFNVAGSKDFKDISNNLLVDRTIDYSNFSVSILYAGNVTTSIQTAGTYRLSIIFNAIDGQYSTSEYTLDLNIIDREFFLTEQIGISYGSAPTTQVNTLQFGANNSAPFYVYFSHPTITNDTHTITYKITGPNNFSTIVLNYDNGHTTTIWGYMPKNVGVYTIEAFLTSKDGYTTKNGMENTFEIVENTSLTFTTNNDNVAEALGEITTSNEAEAIHFISAKALASMGTNINPSTTLFKVGDDITLVSTVDLKDDTLNLFTFKYDALDAGGNITTAGITSITIGGYYQVTISFNGISGYYTGVNNFTTVKFRISDRDAVAAGDIFIGFDYRNEYTRNFDFAEDITGSFFVSFKDEVEAKFDSSEYVIKVLIYNLDGTFMFDYFYYNHVASEVWAQMPKSAGTYKVVVQVQAISDGHNFNDIEAEYIINEANYSINDVTQATIQEAVATIGTYSTNNVRQSLIEKMIAVITPQTVSQTAYVVLNSNYVAVEDYAASQFRFEFSFGGSLIPTEDPIYQAGTYNVVIYLKLDNYLEAKSISMQFTLQALIGLDNDSAVFKYVGANSLQDNTMEFYTGEQYTIDFLTNDTNETIFGASKNAYKITVVIYNSFGYRQEFTYTRDTADSLWIQMPKMIGTYTVETYLVQTIGGNDLELPVSTSELTIYGGITPEIETIEGLDQALAEIYTRDGEAVNDYVRTEILEELFRDGYINLNKQIYTASIVDGAHVLSEELLPTLLNYTFKFYSLEDVYYNSITGRNEFKADAVEIDVTTEGSYGLAIDFIGYNVPGTNTQLFAGAFYGVVEFEVENRSVLSGAGAFVLANDTTPLTTIDYYNNGAPYYFQIPEIEDASTIFNDDYEVLLIFTDEDGNTVEVDYYNPYTQNEKWLASFSQMPKAAGTYTVEVQLVHPSDNYVTSTFTEVTIKATDLTYGLSSNFTAPEVSYNKKSLGTTVSQHYIENDYLEFTINGTTTNVIYMLNEETNLFEAIELTIENFDIVYYNAAGQVITADEVKESGEYSVTITLKEIYNNGYTISSPLEQVFTVAPYEGSLDWRGVAIGATACLAILGLVVLKKSRT